MIYISGQIGGQFSCSLFIERYPVLAGRRANTLFTPHCRSSVLAKFTEPENWPPNSPDINAVDYPVWSPYGTERKWMSCYGVN